MIDTHVHILPGVDDGPQTLQEALLLAFALVQENVYTAIATPHYNDEFPQRSVAEIQERVYALQQELHRSNIPLKLFVGHEALIKPGLIEDIQAGRLATLNSSRYLLLELWNSTWLPDTANVIFELRANGIVPIIAHPERYWTIQQDPKRLVGLLEQGALAQLTAGSVLGIQGPTVQRCAETLLKKGFISCIASDAHDLKRRPPNVLKSLQCVKKLLSQEQIHRMTELQPEIILGNRIKQ